MSSFKKNIFNYHSTKSTTSSVNSQNSNQEHQNQTHANVNHNESLTSTNPIPPPRSGSHTIQSDDNLVFSYPVLSPINEKEVYEGPEEQFERLRYIQQQPERPQQIPPAYRSYPVSKNNVNPVGGHQNFINRQNATASNYQNIQNSGISAASSAVSIQSKPSDSSNDVSNYASLNSVNSAFSYTSMDVKSSKPIPTQRKNSVPLYPPAKLNGLSNQTSNLEPFQPPPRRYLSNESVSPVQNFNTPLNQQQSATSFQSYTGPQRLTSLRSFSSFQSFHSAQSDVSLQSGSTIRKIPERTVSELSKNNIPNRRASLYHRNRIGSAGSLDLLNTSIEEFAIDTSNPTQDDLIRSDTLNTGRFLPNRLTSITRVSISDALDQGLASYHKHDLSNAMMHWNKVIELTRKSSDLFREVKALNNLGCLNMRRGKLTSARAHLKEAWSKARLFVTVSSAKYNNPGPWIDLVNRSLEFEELDIDASPQPPAEVLHRKHSTASIISASSSMTSMGIPKNDPSQGPPIIVLYLNILNNLGKLDYLEKNYAEAEKWTSGCISLADNTLEDFPLPPDYQLPYEGFSKFKSVDEVMSRCEKRKEEALKKPHKVKLSYLHSSILTSKIRATVLKALTSEKQTMIRETRAYYQDAFELTDFYIRETPPMSRKSSLTSSLIAPQPEKYEAMVIANFANFLFNQGNIPHSFRLHMKASNMLMEFKDQIGFAREEFNLSVLMLEIARVSDLYLWVSKQNDSKLSIEDHRTQWIKYLESIKLDLNPNKKDSEIIDNLDLLSSVSGALTSETTTDEIVSNNKESLVGFYFKKEAKDKLKNNLIISRDYQDWHCLVLNMLLLASTKLSMGQTMSAISLLEKIMNVMDEISKNQNKAVLELSAFGHDISPIFISILSQSLSYTSRTLNTSSLLQIQPAIQRIFNTLNFPIDFPNFSDEQIGNLCQQLDVTLFESGKLIFGRTLNQYLIEISPLQKLWMSHLKSIGILYWLLGAGPFQKAGKFSSGSIISGEYRKLWCDESQPWFFKALAIIDNSLEPQPSNMYHYSEEESFVSAAYYLIQRHSLALESHPGSDSQDSGLSVYKAQQLGFPVAHLIASAFEMIQYAHAKVHRNVDLPDLSIHDMLKIPDELDQTILRNNFEETSKYILKSLMCCCSEECMRTLVARMESVVEQDILSKKGFEDRRDEWFGVLSFACPHFVEELFP